MNKNKQKFSKKGGHFLIWQIVTFVIIRALCTGCLPINDNHDCFLSHHQELSDDGQNVSNMSDWTKLHDRFVKGISSKIV